MKDRISATVDKETIKLVEQLLESGKYRNKSHIIEKAIEGLTKMEGKGNDKSK